MADATWPTRLGRQDLARLRPNFADTWRGREDSNLRMAESKSAHFFFEINAHSEKIEKFEPLSINRLSVGSEWFLPCRRSPRLNYSHRVVVLRDTRPIFM